MKKNEILDKALDINNSVWIDANAGSGKTYLLTMRIVKLLLSGKKNILCLTFTNAAKDEMLRRIYNELVYIKSLDDVLLVEHYKNIVGEDLKKQKIEEIRDMESNFFHYIDIYTIHAFCANLLRSESLQGNFNVLEDDSTKIYKRAIFDALSNDDRLILNIDLNELIQILDNLLRHFSIYFFCNSTQSDNLIKSIVKKINHEAVIDTKTVGYYDRELLYYTDKLKLFFSSNVKLLEKKELKKLFDNIKNDNFVKGFLTQKFTPKKNIFKIKNLDADAIYAIQKIQQILILQKNNELTKSIIRDTENIVVILKKVIKHYLLIKNNMMTYDDILHTTYMYCNSLEKEPIISGLYQHIDHVLVDESQDNSWFQWNIIKKICCDVLSNTEQGQTNKTIFLVGDVKQSIYSFQGSNPDFFYYFQESLTKYCDMYNSQLLYVNSNNSYRSSKVVLSFVDSILSIDENMRKYVSYTKERKYLLHNSMLNTSGSVNIHYPCRSILSDTKIKNDLINFHKKDLINEHYNAAVKVVKLIKDYIEVKKNDPRDIMVLVRKRTSKFYRALIYLMNVDNINYAMDVVDSTNIIIQWLKNIVEFALLKYDNQSLLNILKYPPFNFSHHEIEKLCIQKELDFIWNILEKDTLEYSKAYSVLCKWIQYSKESVFVMFRKIFDVSLLSKVERFFGLGAVYIVESFISKMYNVSDLTGLVIDITNMKFKIQYPLNYNGVQIKTVHGAKGLQAKVVVFVDNSYYDHKNTGKMLLSKKDNFFLYSDESLSNILPCDDEDIYMPICKLWKNYKKFNSDFLYGEYLRCIYVAITRAESVLDIVFYGDYRPKGKYDSFCNIIENHKINEIKTLQHMYKNQDYCIDSSEDCVSITFKSNEKIKNDKIKPNKHNNTLSNNTHNLLLPIEVIQNDKELDCIPQKRGELIHKGMENIFDIDGDKVNLYVEDFISLHKIFFTSTDDLTELKNKFVKIRYICTKKFSKYGCSELECVDEKNKLRRIDRVYIDDDNKTIDVLDIKTGLIHNRKQLLDYKNQLSIYYNIMKNNYIDYRIATYILWFDMQKLQRIKINK